MARLKRGDIWLVGFDPTVGHEIKKTRPALIVQNDQGNMYSSTTIVAPLTSQNLSTIYPVEVKISKVKGLNRDAKIMMDQIRTVDKMRLRKYLGRLQHDQMMKVNEALAYSLGLVEM